MPARKVGALPLKRQGVGGKRWRKCGNARPKRGEALAELGVFYSLFRRSAAEYSCFARVLTDLCHPSCAEAKTLARKRIYNGCYISKIATFLCGY